MIRKKCGVVNFLLGGVLAFLFLAQSSVAQQSAEDLYEAALLKKEAAGDLNGAIQLFQKIPKTFPQNREICAKALLQVGMCYEKLGREEAQKAYLQIIKDYGDQPKAVADARARLASLTSAGKVPGTGAALESRTGFTFRKIEFENAEKSHQARLSPDGRKMLYIGVREKEPRFSIRVMDFASGKSLSLVEGVNADVENLIFEWSPDGKKVVFKSGLGELRLIDSEGGKAEALWSAPGKDTAVYPLDWSDQNHAILIALVSRTEKTVRLAMLPEKGGEPRTVVSGDPNELADIAQFSPEGKFIVGMKRKEKNTEIYVWTVDGSSEIRITDHPADDEYPLWSPDGKYIVFVSNRAKTVDLWAVPMTGSQPSGDPVRIQADIGKNKIPSDFTRSGYLTFYSMSSAGRPSDLFVLAVDPKTGEAQGSFRPFASYPTQAMFHRWSPDGTRIAYTSRKGNIQLPNAYVSSGGTNEELEIPAKGYWIGNVEWSRDGKHLLFPGWNNDDGRVGIFRIALENLAIEPVQALGDRYGANFKGAYINLRWLPQAGRYMFGKLLSEMEQEIYTMDPKDYKIERVGEKIGASGWSIPSPDGRYLICILYKEKNIALLSLADGSSKVLCALPPEGWPAFSWSPDGKRFVWNEGGLLKVFSVLDGTTQTPVKATENQKLSGGLVGTPNTAWSPDGTKIAYVLQSPAKSPEARSELWIMDATDGSHRKIADAPSSHPLLSEVVWHPSGKMIVARGQAPEGMKTTFEHWVMENFLPGKK